MVDVAVDILDARVCWQRSVSLAGKSTERERMDGSTSNAILRDDRMSRILTIGGLGGPRSLQSESREDIMDVVIDYTGELADVNLESAVLCAVLPIVIEGLDLILDFLHVDLRSERRGVRRSNGATDLIKAVSACTGVTERQEVVGSLSRSEIHRSLLATAVDESKYLTSLIDI